jgi:hypothetical protein
MTFGRFMAWLLALILAVAGPGLFAYFVIPTHKASDLAFWGLLGAVVLTRQIYDALVEMWSKGD